MFLGLIQYPIFQYEKIILQTESFRDIQHISANIQPSLDKPTQSSSCNNPIMSTTTYQNSFVALGLLSLASAFYSILLPICIRAVKLSKIPLVGKRPGEWFDAKARKRLSQNYCQIVEDGIKQVKKSLSHLWAVALAYVESSILKASKLLARPHGRL